MYEFNRGTFFSSLNRCNAAGILDLRNLIDFKNETEQKSNLEGFDHTIEKDEEGINEERSIVHIGHNKVGNSNKSSSSLLMLSPRHTSTIRSSTRQPPPPTTTSSLTTYMLTTTKPPNEISSNNYAFKTKYNTESNDLEELLNDYLSFSKQVNLKGIIENFKSKQHHVEQISKQIRPTIAPKGNNVSSNLLALAKDRIKSKLPKMTTASSIAYSGAIRRSSTYKPIIDKKKMFIERPSSSRTPLNLILSSQNHGYKSKLNQTAAQNYLPLAMNNLNNSKIVKLSQTSKKTPLYHTTRSLTSMPIKSTTQQSNTKTTLKPSKTTTLSSIFNLLKLHMQTPDQYKIKINDTIAKNLLSDMAFRNRYNLKPNDKLSIKLFKQRLDNQLLSKEDKVNVFQYPLFKSEELFETDGKIDLRNQTFNQYKESEIAVAPFKVATPQRMTTARRPSTFTSPMLTSRFSPTSAALSAALFASTSPSSTRFSIINNPTSRASFTSPTTMQQIFEISTTTLSWLSKLKARLSPSIVESDIFKVIEPYDWSYVLSDKYKQGKLLR
jgi:hypothetical protein